MSIDLKKIDYSLAENIILNEKVNDVGFKSVISVVQCSYQRTEVVEEILKLRRTSTSTDKWDTFEVNFANSIIKKSECDGFHPLVKSIVNVSVSDMYSMNWKVPDDDEFRLLLKYLVLNFQDGSINLHKTVRKMLYESSLSKDLKFELACKYFVGKDMVIKYGKFLSPSIRSSMCCNEPHCVRCIPLKFWQGYIDDDDVLDSSLSNGEVNVPPKKFKAEVKHNFSYYFKWALSSVNDIAVQYLWENLAPTMEDKRKCSAYTHSALLKFGMTNIAAYIITKTEGDNTLFEVGKIADGDAIMENFLRNSRWHKYVLNIIKVSREKIPVSFVSQCIGFVSALKDSKNKSLDTKLYRSLLEEFLKTIPNDGTVIELFRECKAGVLYPILKMMDFEALKLLMKIYKETDVLSLLDSDVGIRLYHKKISECAFSEVEEFLKKVFNSDEVMSKFLSRVVDDCYLNLCERFILTQNMEGLNLFSNWCEKFLPEVLNNKRTRLSCKSNGNILRQILFSTVNKFENPFEYSDDFLLWCLEFQELVDEFKKCIAFSKSILKEEKKAYYGLYFYDDFRRCVERSQYELLDKFFNWCGCDSATVSRIKNQMSRDNRISKHFCNTKNSDGFWKFLRWVNNEME